MQVQCDSCRFSAPKVPEEWFSRAVSLGFTGHAEGAPCPLRAFVERIAPKKLTVYQRLLVVGAVILWTIALIAFLNHYGIPSWTNP